MSILLEGLNPQQKQVVEMTDGAILVLAGAGSGKTKALTHRLAFLLEQGLALPNEILALTFTNKAAKEMEGRVYDLVRSVDYPVHEPLTLSTFHSFGAKILRRHADHLGYDARFTIYDETDQLQMVKKVLSQLGVSDTQLEPKQAMRWINHTKADSKSGDTKVGHGPRATLFDEVFKAYEVSMRKSNAMDFADLLYKTHILFKSHPDVLHIYSELYRYVMVDEYQDTNYLQYQLIRLLTQTHRNLCVVGDEDQSIYSWRGADISNILNFESDFPDAQVVRLEQNYRSTQVIVEAASHVIRNNLSRKGKELFTENVKGDLIQLQIEPTDFDESKWVTRKIEALINDGVANVGDCAVLYRTNAQSRLLEEQLRLKQLPYRIVGGLRFYDRAEIKDALGYMRIVYNPKDDVALRRIINTPTRGIGKTTVDKLVDMSISQGLSLWESCYYAINQKSLHSGTLRKLHDFLMILEKLSEAQGEKSLLDFYVFMLEETGYIKSLKTENSEEAKNRMGNLEEFSNAIEQFEKESSEPSLQSFLEEMALVSDLDQVEMGTDAITLMTVHMAKGLEFPYVFVVGLEEGLFPSGRGEEKLDDLEEERRLFYVAMTRAEKQLYLTAARQRRVWGQEQYNAVARFVAEIPKDYILSNLTSKPASSFQSRFAKPAQKSTWADDFEAQTFFDDNESSGSLSVREGARVKHPSFGKGVIRAVEGEGEDTKLTVIFEGQSVKKFIAKYAKLEYLG